MKRTAVMLALLGGLTGAFGGCKRGSAPQEGASKSVKALSGSHVGDAFKINKITTLDTVFADPQAHLGKVIRLQGTVVAFCHHRRAWFALGNKAKGQMIRVTCTPKFKVPDGVVNGKSRAETEGSLEEKVIPERFAKHLAGEHGLFGGQPEKVQGPQKLLSLRATGATFK